MAESGTHVISIIYVKGNGNLAVDDTGIHADCYIETEEKLDGTLLTINCIEKKKEVPPTPSSSGDYTFISDAFTTRRIGNMTVNTFHKPIIGGTIYSGNSSVCDGLAIQGVRFADGTGGVGDNPVINLGSRLPKNVTINGTRYSPYTLRNGSMSGKSVLVPEGMRLEDSPAPAGTQSAPSAQSAQSAQSATPAETKEYLFGKNKLDLCKISISGCCSVRIAPNANVNASYFEASVSGVSELTITKPEINKLVVSLFNTSKITCDARIDRLMLSCRECGVANISMCSRVCQVMASDCSKANITVTRECETKCDGNCKITVAESSSSSS